MSSHLSGDSIDAQFQFFVIFLNDLTAQKVVGDRACSNPKDVFIFLQGQLAAASEVYKNDAVVGEGGVVNPRSSSLCRG